MTSAEIQRKFGPATVAFRDAISQILSKAIGKKLAEMGAEDRKMILFTDNLTKYMTEQAMDVGDTPGGRALITWGQGIVPQARTFLPTLEYLFAGDTLNPGYLRLKAQWDAARAERDGASKARRGVGAAIGADDAEPGVSDFDADGDPPLQQGLVELRIDPPARGGNTPNLVAVRVALSFAEYGDMVEGHGVMLALTDATLVPTYATGCVPERNSRAGEADNPNTALAHKSGQWVVSGPRNEAGHLDGEPLSDDQPLLTLRVPGQETDGLSLTLRSKPKALVVIPDDPEDESRITKDKLLQLLLQRAQASDKDGWITWGRAGLHRKKPE